MEPISGSTLITTLSHDGTLLGIKEEPATVELGYFNISEKDDETKINIANFTEEQMQEAVESFTIVSVGFGPTKNPPKNVSIR